jgi:WD40 repeat protein
MPRTPAVRAAAARAAARRLIELPADVLGLVLYQLLFAHDIAAVAPTCRALCDAAKLALKLRPFSGEVVTLAGHAETVCGVSATPDGCIVTCEGGRDRTIRMFRGATCVWSKQADGGPRPVAGQDYVNAAAVAGTRVISGWASSEDSNGKVRIYTREGVLESTIETGVSVHKLAVHPDGIHFAASVHGLPPHPLHPRADIRLYRIDGTLVHTFEGHMWAVHAMVFTRDGQHLISGSNDNLVKVWSVASKSLLSTCIGHDDQICAVAAMPDGQRILSSSGGTGDGVWVWKLDGTLEKTFDLHNHVVNALVALPDNQHALSGSFDETVKLFDVDDGAVLRTFRHHSTGVAPSDVICLALLPDGLRFVSGSEDKTACIVYHGLALK